MKKIIDGLLYDTDAAKLVKTSEWKDFGYMGDWIGADRLLFYKTPNDRFFWVYQQRQVGGCFRRKLVDEITRESIEPASEQEWAYKIYEKTGEYPGKVEPA